MFQVYFRHGFLTSAVVLLIVCSIICQIIIGVYYQSMLRATENMTATDNKLLKQCKLKFMNCYQVNGGVLNVPVFVDKFLSKIRFWGMSLNGIYRLGGQLILFSVLVSGIGICRLIVTGEDLSELIPYYVLSIFGLYLYFSVSSIVDMSGRKKDLKTNLVDYLENHMAARLSEVEPISTRKQEKRELSEERAGNRVQEKAKEKTQEKPEGKKNRLLFSKSEEEELKTLLKELFATE